MPNLDRIIPMVKQPYGLHWLKLWLACAPRFWSLVVDLRRSAFAYTVIARRRRIVGRSHEGVHKLRQLADTLGLAEAPAPHLWTGPAHDAAAARLVPKAGGPVLAIGPTANWRGKQWRGERFAALAERLTAPDGPVPGARIAVLAAAHERAQAAPLLAATPASRLVDLVGRTDLLTAASVLRRAAMFIGNDTGLMHIAAAAGTPTLGLFGPSPIAQYAPWGSATAFVRTTQPPEEMFGPGFDHRLTDTLMDSLSVEMAAAAARDLWHRVQSDVPSVIPGRRNAANPEPIFQRPMFMGSGFAAEGRTPE
ncbi:MAG: glycosyltransferase family 9 protein [Stellaceae bacterium]